MPHRHLRRRHRAAWARSSCPRSTTRCSSRSSTATSTRAVVVGSLWNGKDKPSYSQQGRQSKTKRFQSNDDKFLGKTEAKKNDMRSISTRAKHELVFNDNADKPRVALRSGQKHRIVLNDKDNQPTQIEIYDGKEENYILIDTKNKKITIETKTGDILIKAKETIRLEAKTIETESRQETPT